ncbi:MAG: cytidylyltransferase domain-containing protein [Bacteroidia bacterium]
MNYIFIQARLGSTRLPGKVLKDMAGKPQLLQMVNRLKNINLAHRIVVVTSDLEIDNPIEAFCKEHKLLCGRGSEGDVLDRFYQAAKQLHLTENDIIVRVTADCPLHNGEVIDFAIGLFERHQLDYFSNSFAPHYEDGCDTEVFRFKTLEIAAKNAKLLSQREHVTPYIKDAGIFVCGYKKFHPDFQFKLSVDTPEDHAAVSGIFQHFAPRTNFSIHEIVELVKANPALLDSNKDSVINAGYAKSLAEDKEIGDK